MWKDILVFPAWRWIVVVPFAALGAYQTIQQQFLSAQLPPRLPFLPAWPWWVWSLTGLLLVCVLILEGAYRKTVAIEEASHALLAAVEAARNEARQRIRELEQNAQSVWFFRIGYIGNAWKDVTTNSREAIVTVELSITNQRSEPASISHFVLETITPEKSQPYPEGNPEYSDPVSRSTVEGAEAIPWCDEFFAPLYFQPKEAKVGQLTFVIKRMGFGEPSLYIRDGEGTEYRIVLTGKTMIKIASGLRRIDYPK